LRTALVAWLYARSTGGRFLLRIEDLDPQRSRAEFETEQLRQLEQLGIDWDGEVVRQSRRGALYAEALDRLTDQLYPCFCSRAAIREAASAPHGELPEGAYPGTCRALSTSERSRRIDAGERHALRFDAGAEQVTFTDQLLGEQSYAVDDFVVRRADGVVAYQLAVVVDDHAQGVEVVVRGADLLDSTPRQIVLQRALGIPGVSYAHVPLVLGPDGARLAKRHGAATALTEPLGWLATSLGIEPGSPARAGDLLAAFDPASIPLTPVRV
jgi:glutamyl-tRNA synthetase